jgi:hypothetical protein
MKVDHETVTLVAVAFTATKEFFAAFRFGKHKKVSKGRGKCAHLLTFRGNDASKILRPLSETKLFIVRVLRSGIIIFTE